MAAIKKQAFNELLFPPIEDAKETRKQQQMH